jgi:excisionase family DNA binding protein
LTIDNRLTTTQAAQQYGVPERTLQAAAKRGDLPAARMDVRGGVYLLRPADVEAFTDQWRQRRNQRRATATGGEQEVRGK